MDTRLAIGSFYGQTLQSHHIGEWIFTESVYPDDTRIPCHTHDSAFFYLVIAGVCNETVGKQVRTCNSLSLIFHPAGESHSNHWKGSEGRCFHIEIASARLKALQEQAPVLNSPAEYQGGPPTWLAVRLYREFQHMDPLSSLAMEGLTLALLAEASRNQDRAVERHAPRWLRQARDLLQDRFQETLSLEQVAAAVDIHPTHLARVFHQHYDCTIGDYVRRLRIERACRQLSSSQKSLSEIAIDLGFADQSHFCKTFKNLMGLTPTEFRRNYRIGNAGTNR